MSSPRSSPTSKKAVRPEPAEPVVEIGFAGDTDAEAIELHRFLCLISAPVLLAPLDAKDSMEGVIDVLHNGFAVTARADGHLIGSLGIVSVPWWYNKAVSFMTDRWLFCYPQFWNQGIGDRMKLEAKAIADAAGQEIVVHGHQKRRGNGISYRVPEVLGTGGK